MTQRRPHRSSMCALELAAMPSPQRRCADLCATTLQQRAAAVYLRAGTCGIFRLPRTGQQRGCAWSARWHAFEVCLCEFLLGDRLKKLGLQRFHGLLATMDLMGKLRSRASWTSADVQLHECTAADSRRLQNSICMYVQWHAAKRGLHARSQRSSVSLGVESLSE